MMYSLTSKERFEIISLHFEKSPSVVLTQRLLSRKYIIVQRHPVTTLFIVGVLHGTVEDHELLD